MFKNYIKTALRNLWKNRFYSGINLLGLSSGMLCFLFIAAFVQDELSFNRFHEKGERIVRMNFLGEMGENDLTVPQLGAPVGAVMKEEFPEVESFVRFRETGEYLVRYENQSFQERKVVHADSTLLDIFDFVLIDGDPNSILRQAGTAIVTQSIAKKYFGNQNPIGKTIQLDNESDYVVNGVLADLPENSTIQQDIFLAMADLPESRETLWTNMNFETYFLLREGAKIAKIEAKLPEFLRRHLGSEMEQFLKISFDDFLAAGNSGAFTILPLHDIYLHSEFQENLGPSSDIKYLYIFGAVGLFILLLAAINFVNLATARASTRSREVGVRKVVGAGRRQLMGQFLSESTLLAFMALGVALIGMAITLPYFNELAGKSISMGFFTEQPLMVFIGFSLVALIGLLAGVYPSFVLAGFKPLEAIQQRVQGNGRSHQSGLRGALVVFQFAITTLLLVGTLTVYQQMQFVQEKKLGYNKEQLLLIDGAYGLGDQLSAFTSQLEMDARVKHLATTSYLPTPSSRNKSGYFLGNSPDKSALYMMQVWYVDENYLPTIDIELVEGRNFEPTTETGTTTNVIVNEAAIREFRLTGDVIGQQISRNFGEDAGDQSELHVYNIVGVVKDFHFESLHHKIDPLVLHQSQSTRFVAARVTPTDLPGLLTDIEQKWKALAPHQPFQYTFLDEGFSQMYEAEIRMSKVARLFAFLSILIASIGLLGLATFTALQRQKEVSIRKVLGASVSGLFLLLTRDFGKLILIALVISLPLSWYLMQQWLQGFVYATAISIGTFFLTGGVLLLVALLAVGFQSLRTALGNPVDALRGT
ncbi:ABC transporter permease [Lewinella cohaerens]|uniref:ABC transporter permease n=1 Tax=Lewinella cohaerens TaxID=70995 RepID=UPI0003785EC9|nr:ABC transporter permease [Lewinella cohaerens]